MSVTKRLSRLLVCTGLVAGATLVPVGVAGATTTDWIDTGNRAEVVAAYDAEYSSATPAIGWTGDRGSCQAGSTSSGYRAAIFDRINWYRAMAGVPTGVTENPTYSAKAQEAALMMSVSGRLSHNPDGSFGCYTSNGDQAAGSSNLYLGRTGPAAIDGYMYDPGSGNVSVGHRNWILHPTSQQFGTGDIPSGGGWASNALWVFDNNFAPQPELREDAGFVAWPPRGFVPGEVVYPRWSFGLRGANFNDSSVSVNRVDGGGGLTPVSSPIVHQNASGGAPFSIMVWEPQGVDLSPTVDTTYRVCVSDVGVSGASRNFAYEVTILGDAPASTVAASTAGHAGFITAAYNDFLGRNPTSAELAQWNAELGGCTSRADFVQHLAESEEWTAFVVDQMYLDTLGRTADAAGRAFWIDQIQRGMSVADAAALFYGSPEYLAREGNSYDAWVEDLYRELLYRSPDGPGLTFWTGQAGTVGTEWVALSFYQSVESRRTRVSDLFERFLDRAPDAAGHAYWAEVLTNGDDIALAAHLAASDEYFQRN